MIMIIIINPFKIYELNLKTEALLIVIIFLTLINSITNLKNISMTMYHKMFGF